MTDYFTFHSRWFLYQQTHNESNLIINTRTKWKSQQTKCLIRFCHMKSTENNDLYIQVFSKAQKLSASPNNYSRLKVPVNSPAIWNVSIALWSGCKSNHHLHLVSFKPLTPFPVCENKSRFAGHNTLHHRINLLLFQWKCQCTIKVS